MKKRMRTIITALLLSVIVTNTALASEPMPPGPHEPSSISIPPVEMSYNWTEFDSSSLSV